MTQEYSMLRVEFPIDPQPTRIPTVRHPYVDKLAGLVGDVEEAVEDAWRDGRRRRAAHWARRLLRLEIALLAAEEVYPRLRVHGPARPQALNFRTAYAPVYGLSEAVKRMNADLAFTFHGEFPDR